MALREKKQVKRSHGTQIVFLVLFSLVTGFFLGLIFAPKKGARFRKELLEGLKEVADRARFSLVEARVMGEELLEKSMEKVGEVSSKIRGKPEEATKKE